MIHKVRRQEKGARIGSQETEFSHSFWTYSTSSRWTRNSTDGRDKATIWSVEWMQEKQVFYVSSRLNNYWCSHREWDKSLYYYNFTEARRIRNSMMVETTLQNEVWKEVHKREKQISYVSSRLAEQLATENGMIAYIIIISLLARLVYSGIQASAVSLSPYIQYI